MNPVQRSAHMAKIKSKNTKPEMLLRKGLHASGFRYRLHDAKLPGKPDLVFPSRRKVIFVNGCFWHGHDCPVGARLPKSNTEFWIDKRERNQARDQPRSPGSTIWAGSASSFGNATSGRRRAYPVRCRNIWRETPIAQRRPPGDTPPILGSQAVLDFCRSRTAEWDGDEIY